MSYSEPARTTTRRVPGVLVGTTLVVSATLIGVLIGQALASSPSSVTSPPIDTPHGDPGPAVIGSDPDQPTTEDRGQHNDHGRRDRRDPAAPPGKADGAVPDGVRVFDDGIPAVAKLDPDLLGAVRQAATDAADAGVEFYVSSGWRSPGYQEQLLRQAVSEYGSEKEAARWVATADTSPHVSGDAIDIGPFDATAWLSEHGAGYGLCQIYSNEPWHYELRPEAIDHGCPAMYADPTHDPRMQQ